MKIRKEENKDYAEIYEVVKRAFNSAEQADGNEQDLVNALRAGDSYIPQLSLVVEENGKIVGHRIARKLGYKYLVVLGSEKYSSHLLSGRILFTEHFLSESSGIFIDKLY